MKRATLVFTVAGFLMGSVSAPASSAAQSTIVTTLPSQSVRLEGTSFSVSLPPDWEIAPAKLKALTSTAIHYKGEPAFEITVIQNDKTPNAQSVGLPFECDFLFSVLQAASNAKRGNNTNQSAGAQTVSRPDFIPEEYYSRMMVNPPTDQGGSITTCLYLGNSQLAIMVRPAPGPADGAKLTPVLHAIADSAKRTSTLLYAPGSLKLPILGITAWISSGIWAAGTASLPAPIGTRDLLVRVSGASELKIMPIISAGTCSLRQNPSHNEAPPYISSKWEPASLEASAPNGKLQIMVCRQIAPAKVLQMQMLYEAPEVPATDAAAIATVLDDIAQSIITGLQYVPQPASAGISSAGVQSNDESRKRCGTTGDPKPRIVACTALIESGQMTTEDATGALNSRGMAYLDNSDPDRAILDFSEAIRLKPEAAIEFLNRGTAYASKGDYVHALQDFTDAIRVKPDYADAFADRGFVYERQEQYAMASQNYDEAIRLAPGDYRTQNAACWAHAVINDLQTALKDCNESLRLKNDPNTLDSRGFVYLKMNNIDGAISDYNKVLLADPKVASSLYGRGLAERIKGEKDASDADIAAAVKLQPDIANQFAKWGIPTITGQR